jgi:phage terminase large subunit-like protein
LNIREIAKLIPGHDPFATAGDCWFDDQAAQLACDFFPECLRHIEGAVAGQPFTLEPWQKAIVANLFGWKRRDAQGRTVRRYREAFIFVPRKNGKTPLVAGIGLYVFFCDDERGQQNYVAAADREQAGMLFRHAKGMVEQEPELARRCRIYGGNAAAGQSRSIVRESDGSFLRVVSADADTKHGGNPHLIVIDELHAQPNAELYDVLHTGMASQNRAQPLFITLTTADYDRESVCNERYEYASKVRDGKIPDVTFLPVIYEATEKDDWTSPATWAKANPNLGVSVSIDYLKSECEKAQRIPRLQNTFKRLHLDMKTKQDVLWLPIEAWNACGGDRLELPAGVPVFGGLDLSSKIDVTALAWLWRADGKVLVKLRFWVPENRIRRLENEERDPRYRLWQEAGWLESTPGDVVDYDFIRAAIRADSERCSIQQIGYDPWNATQTAVALQEQDGFTMIEFRQGYASMNEPSKELERLITAREIVHERSPVLDWMVENAKARPDPAGNIKPVKPDPGGKQKIDGVVAMLIALGVEMRQPAVESAYEDHGVLYADEIDDDENEEVAGGDEPLQDEEIEDV